MPGVQMPAQRQGTMQEVMGLASTAASIASAKKAFSGDAAADPGKAAATPPPAPTPAAIDPSQANPQAAQNVGMSGAINRRIAFGGYA